MPRSSTSTVFSTLARSGERVVAFGRERAPVAERFAARWHG
jgi:hypothetical protein